MATTLLILAFVIAWPFFIVKVVKWCKPYKD